MKFRPYKFIGPIVQIYFICSFIGFILFISRKPYTKQEVSVKTESKSEIIITKVPKVTIEKPLDIQRKVKKEIDISPTLIIPEEVEEPISTPSEEPLPGRIEEPADVPLAEIIPEEVEEPADVPSAEIIPEEVEEPVDVPSTKATPETVEKKEKAKKLNGVEYLESKGLYFMEKYKPKKAQYYFKKLICSHPKSAYYYYLYGAALSQTFQINQAKKALEKSIWLDPTLKNAKIELGNILTVQRRYKKARKYFNQYPDEPYAEIGLANIEIAKNNFCGAKKAFKEILKEHPNNYEARYGLAISQASLLEYESARELLVDLIHEKPQLHYIPPTLFKLENYLRPSIDLFYEYTISDDYNYRKSPPLDRYKIYRNQLFINYPTSPTNQLAIGGFNGYERYKRVQDPKEDLFLADVMGIEIHNKNQFAPLWSIDIYGRYKRAIRDGTMTFPFKSTSRVEPGIDLTYDSTTHYLDLTAYADSFIILNFSETTSELLQRNRFKGSYEYRLPFYTSSKIGAMSEYILYDDNLDNNQAVQTVYLRAGIPEYTEYFTVGYLFNYSDFKTVALNYYSYDYERKHEVMVEFHPRWNSRTFLHLRYTHGWIHAKNVQLATSTAEPLVPKAIYKANTIQALLTHRITERSYFELASSYLYATFPYKEAKVYGKLIYLF